jgi:hypothetical protein
MMINDPKERERWTSKRCCNNCQHLRSKSPTWPFSTNWCMARKKHLICDLNYDHGCKKFVSHFTPEENKQLWLDLLKLGVKSRRQRGREYQEHCKHKKEEPR